MSDSTTVAMAGTALALTVQIIGLAYWAGRVRAEGQATREHIDTRLAYVPTREDLATVRGDLREQVTRIDDHGRRLDVVEKRVRAAELRPQEAS